MPNKKTEVVLDNATGESLELHSQQRRRTISVLVENNVGTLSHIVDLFTARGYSIDSLCVAPTEDPQFSRLTIVSVCYDETIEQIKKHLNKLIDVHTVRNLTDESHVSRELLLVKIMAKTTEQKEAIKHLTDIFRARIIDVSDHTYIVEVTGHYKKTNAFIKAVNPEWILETVFSGINAMGKGTGDKSGFWKPVIESQIKAQKPKIQSKKSKS